MSGTTVRFRRQSLSQRCMTVQSRVQQDLRVERSCGWLHPVRIRCPTQPRICTARSRARATLIRRCTLVPPEERACDYEDRSRSDDVMQYGEQ
ncbi:hypothetical protein HanRHA438_Chr05g0231581 [Helianthus annuus]|uniref:Uncharacterized protein n=2 Tax=Helianthus annuus TaxID=4232 RepID=A0A9K3J0D0_HELAN|nr:hypothetical protein HanXRQr2_Chr05g0222531 [Helianthus annuus]KAJ0570789.1 hypothetical protein HanHA300_Chr05g0182111 [Helianthus annuus]KAJ0577741.1 hypothetical protein HanIR_Chr05g0239471 [Helianthus annuus]KAJ0585129.1 hypothetical protein HanHA89_Chr05g0196781 [Helianthus annuus]KAJ0919606.1 hypothetical protein HanRHA438_Chr05g0231581 [Helianthus annuus]